MVISRSFLVCTPACACDQLLCVTEHQLIFANPRWLITKTRRNSCNSIRPIHATLCFSWLIQSSPININFSQTIQLCSWVFPICHCWLAWKSNRVESGSPCSLQVLQPWNWCNSCALLHYKRQNMQNCAFYLIIYLLIFHWCIIEAAVPHYFNRINYKTGILIFHSLTYYPRVICWIFVTKVTIFNRQLLW